MNKHVLGKSELGNGWGLTRNIPFPNIYVKMLPDYKGWIYLEEDALGHKGSWRQLFSEPHRPLDLEIGCGNGFFFAEQASRETNRNLLGIELKYKPLVQTVRRVKTVNRDNAKGIRFHARYIDKIFAEQELDNVFIYFPDPWPRKRQHRNRLVRREFLEMLAKLQKKGRWVDFKTDSEDYFDFVVEELKNSPCYKVVRFSRDLHNSEWASENFMTSFEKIFTKKGQPIFYVRFERQSLS